MATFRHYLSPLRCTCGALRPLKISGYCNSTSSPPTSDCNTTGEHAHEVASTKDQPAAYVSPTGWAPPTGKPAPLGVKPDIPFRVRRSVYHQLPVYSEYRNGRTRVLTRISKIDGNIVKLEQMLRKNLRVKNLKSRVDGVTGSVYLSGDHRVAVRKFLKDLGF